MRHTYTDDRCTIPPEQAAANAALRAQYDATVGEDLREQYRAQQAARKAAGPGRPPIVLSTDKVQALQAYKTACADYRAACAAKADALRQHAQDVDAAAQAYKTACAAKADALRQHAANIASHAQAVADARAHAIAQGVPTSKL